MADAQVKLNPLKVLILTKEDDEWRSLNPSNITPACNWLVHLEFEPEEDPEEILSMHEVNRRLSRGVQTKGKEWSENMLKELSMLAEDGRLPHFVSPVAGALRHRTMI